MIDETPMAKYRVTVDTGGTFSDFVFFNEDSGEISITKVPSTPKEPFQAVLNGVKELIDQGAAARDISFFCHGTTVGTNTLLEEKGAKTGLLVTQGFRGIYEVMEQTRGYGPATYDLFFEKPRLLAPPYLTEEIPERVDFHGNALKPIDVEASLQAIRNLKKKGVQSVAVCFLFSFLNPDHELKIKEMFAKEFPEARLSLSYEVLPQIREFYRMSTTVINAYIAPVMASYLSRLENRLREMGVTTPKLYIMQSNGGVSTFEGSARETGGHGALRPGRRRDRVHGHLRAGRHQQHHHLRHGRHQLRRRADPPGQSGHHHPGKNQPAPHQSADARHSHRQRRRRHHRAHRRGRRAASRTRQRRRRSWSGVLRPRRRKKSRSPTPTWSSGSLTRIIFSAAG